MYMLYTAIGCLFLILFGLEIAYHMVWLGPEEGWTEVEPLQGHPVAYNLTGHIVPMVCIWFIIIIKYFTVSTVSYLKVHCVFLRLR